MERLVPARRDENAPQLLLGGRRQGRVAAEERGQAFVHRDRASENGGLGDFPKRVADDGWRGARSPLDPERRGRDDGRVGGLERHSLAMEDVPRRIEVAPDPRQGGVVPASRVDL